MSRTPTASGAPERYDLLVLGAGPAGLSAARAGRRLGLEVLLVDERDPGGDCTWRGCVPSKTLVRLAAEAKKRSPGGGPAGSAESGRPPPEGLESRRGPSSGEASGPDGVFSELRRVVLETAALESPAVLAAEGLEFLKARARFSDPKTVLAGGRILRASRVILATGTRVFLPDLPGLDRVPFLTSDTVFDLGRVPESLLILGAGPTGLEIGQAFRRLGCRVTILEKAATFLPEIDRAPAEFLLASLKKEGLDLHFGADVRGLERGPAGVVVRCPEGSFEAERLLIASGRAQNLGGLGLAEAGVAWSGEGVFADEYLRTTNPRVFAAGDLVAGSPGLSSLAGDEGLTAALGARLPFLRRPRAEFYPRTIFTEPALASLGRTEVWFAKNPKKKPRVVEIPYGELDRDRCDGSAGGLARWYLDRRGRVVGACFAGAAAPELVFQASMLVKLKIPLRRLALTPAVYPSYSELTLKAARRALLAWLGR